MMKLSFGQKLVYFLNIIFALILLLSYITSYISPLSFPFFAIINFSIPILWVINLIFLLFWIYKLNKRFFLSTLVLALGWFHFQKLFVFSDKGVYTESGIKVMSYNVMQFYSKKDVQKSTYQDIKDFVDKENPMILCLQEYRIKNNGLFPSYLFNTINNSNNFLRTAIFSKYPIFNFKHYNFYASNNSAVYADILTLRGKVRVFSIHFESLNFEPSIDNIKNQEKEKLIKRLQNSFEKQIKQLEQIKEDIQNSPYPVIVCADMNNTPLSYLYKDLTGLGLKDAFLESGQNFGKTFDYSYFPVRIDMIFTSKKLKSVQFYNYNSIKHSDHYPIMTEILKD